MVWRILLMAAILTWGTATSRIDLLDEGSGFWHDTWEAVSMSFKETWVDSRLAEGRRLQERKIGTAIETMTFKVRGKHMDELARELSLGVTQREQGALYWTSGWQDSVVYIKAKGECETNSRYAVIYNALLGPISDPFGQPIFSPYNASVTDGYQITFERGPWLDVAPGSSTCVQLSAQQDYVLDETEITATPRQSTDDAYATLLSPGTYNDNDTVLILGNLSSDGKAMVTGIRFTNINIPQGSTIIKANIQFRASTGRATDECHVSIFGEDRGNTGTFLSENDFRSRWQGNKTSNYINWDKIEHFVAGNDYLTPDFTNIIQEIVDRDDWSSGNAMTIYLQDNGSDSQVDRVVRSWDHLTDPAPILSITYESGDATTYGRAATCDNEVYFSNKANRANLSHVWYDDGGVFSGNLIGDTLPLGFFPAGPASGDICYFGIDTSIYDSGPFASLVFDIGVAAIFSGDATITWEYWNGGWVTLTVNDNTNDGTGAFDSTGVNSVHWEQPSDWATTTINGITGYWVRANLAFTSGGMTQPTQQNRDFYTIVWPFVEMAAAQVGGDFPALAKIWLFGQSDQPTTTNPELYSDRVIVGLRSVDRGANFAAYLNFSDEQNQTGIRVRNTNLPAAAPSVFANDVTSATGRVINWTPAAAFALTHIVEVKIAQSIARDFLGTYHAFIRAQQLNETAGDVKVQLRVAIGGGQSEIYSSVAIPFTAVDKMQALDMGVVKLPSSSVLLSGEAGPIFLLVYASSTGGTEVLRLYDLILIPVDEWAGEFVAPVRDADGDSRLGYWSRLAIDSVDSPKITLRAIKEWTEVFSGTGSIWTRRSPGPAIFQNGKQQRLWFFTLREDDSADEISEPWVANSVQAFNVQRYEYLRGSR